jgi:hypothetical protein
MKTQTKLGISVYLNCVVTLLMVFSKPLHFPESFQWPLIIGQFILLGFAFYFIRQQKREKQQSLSAAGMPAAPPDDERQKIKNRLILMMILGSLIGLCGPLWMPVTGTTLGVRGDFIVGLITAAIVCTIIGFRLKRV